MYPIDQGLKDQSGIKTRNYICKISELQRTCFNFDKYPDAKVAHIPEEREGKFTTYLS